MIGIQWAKRTVLASLALDFINYYVVERKYFYSAKFVVIMALVFWSNLSEATPVSFRNRIYFRNIFMNNN